jgi:hypothetical protein
MTRNSVALLALLALAGPAQAHQIWIEQPEGRDAIVRFGEFGENLREGSPGLLDKFGKPAGTLLSAKGEKASGATKQSDGFVLPFRAAGGDSIVAEDAQYPLYSWKQDGKETINRFYPAARLITGRAAAPARARFYAGRTAGAVGRNAGRPGQVSAVAGWVGRVGPLLFNSIKRLLRRASPSSAPVQLALRCTMPHLRLRSAGPGARLLLIRVQGRH